MKCAAPEITVELIDSLQAPNSVLELRNRVYVKEGRISTIDAYDAEFATEEAKGFYVLARVGSEAAGTLKVIWHHPEHGLPCQRFIALDVDGDRQGFVEFGHLLVAPEFRSPRLPLALMRVAFSAAIKRGATHIFGDVFLENDQGEDLPLYTMLGFRQVGEAYRDGRFLEAPLSAVICLDIKRATLEMPHCSPAAQRLRQSFL